jgi:hypothetical protein
MRPVTRKQLEEANIVVESLERLVASGWSIDYVANFPHYDNSIKYLWQVFLIKKYFIN